MVLESVEVDRENIEKIKQKIESFQDLNKTLQRLQKKQKNVVTTNGPHPHHQNEQFYQS